MVAHTECMLWAGVFQGRGGADSAGASITSSRVGLLPDASKAVGESVSERVLVQ